MSDIPRTQARHLFLSSSPGTTPSRMHLVETTFVSYEEGTAVSGRKEREVIEGRLELGAHGEVFIDKI